VPELIACANNKNPDQPQPNAASDQYLCCLLLSKGLKHHYPSSKHDGVICQVKLSKWIQNTVDFINEEKGHEILIRLHSAKIN